ncbi:hypothetical protein [Hymenobacter bucti]|uniref:Uncharacterized protein n=1 Tax=Hymenobacter bucti TaxID=1844114 RepID=A0ABW4QSH9_9BACT
MNGEEFRLIVQNYICPILAGAVITPQLLEAEGQTHALAALKNKGQAMHISPSKKAGYKIEITRHQPFSSDDTKLVEAIVAQIAGNFDKTLALYQERVISYAIELGLCKFLCAPEYIMLAGILDGFENWSARTYEGRKPTFTIVVDFENKQVVDKQHPSILEVLTEDFFAPLSNSVESGVLISTQGAILDYVSFLGGELENNSYAPSRFMAVANYADKDRVCFSLTNNGEVLIFKNKKLFFSKRNGGWSYYNHDSTMRIMAGSSTEVKRAMYETILDVSFARTGGCLAAVPLAHEKSLIKDGGRSAESTIKADDLLARPSSVKSRAISRLVQGRRFQDISRTMRKELVGIDGATILNYQGEILAVGAIIKISGGSTGGGRLAATETLAPHGTAIKISADGMVKAFNAVKDGKPEVAFKL